MAYSEFIAEAEEHLEMLYEKIDMLRQYQGADIPPTLINEIFRSAHTLKGISYTAGYQNMGALAHSMEDVFNAIRMGEVEVNDDLLNYIERGLSLMKSMLQSVSEGGDDMVVGVEELTSSMRELISAPTKEQITKITGLDEGISSSLTVYEEHRLQENIKKSRNILKISLQLSVEDFETSLRKIMDDINSDSECEVITVLPNPLDDPSKIGFELITGSSYSLGEFSSKHNIDDKLISTIFTAKRIERGIEPATLRSASRAVRVDIKKLESIMNVVGEIVLAKNMITDMLERIAAGLGEAMSRTSLDLRKYIREMERRLFELQVTVMEARMIPIGDLFIRLERDIKQTGQSIGKNVRILREGGEVEIDKVMAEGLIDSLMHISRNAIGHGIEHPKDRIAVGKDEAGTIILRAKHIGSHISIEIEDDGKGIDPREVFERFKRLKDQGLAEFQIDEKYFYTTEGTLDPTKVYEILFLPGFSIKDKPDEVAGRGVGLDVVKDNILRFGGTVDIWSDVGKGTKFSITLPITLVIVQAILVRWNDVRYAVPLSSIHECVSVDSVSLGTVKGRRVFDFRGSTVPILVLDELFGREGLKEGEKVEDAKYIIVVGFKGRMAGVLVNDILGRREVVIKPMSEEIIRVEGISGVAELGDRRLVLVIDVATLVQKAARMYVS